MVSPTLLVIQNQLNLYVNAIFTIMGNIGNIFIIIMFSRQCKTACPFYITSAAVVNAVFLTVNAYFQIFPFDCSSGTLNSIIFCKVSAYVLNILGQTAKTIFLFACIDRFLITSVRTSVRAFSTIKRAKYFILFSFLFWSVFTLHVPLMRTVTNGRCAASGIYSTIFALLFVSLFPTITSALFGYLTYQNIQKVRIRVRPMARNYTLQRKDRDLLLIVSAEIITYIVTTLLYPITLLETIISSHSLCNKSILYSQIEGFILSIAYLLLFSNSTIPFYTYFIASKSFRRDFYKLTKTVYYKISRHTYLGNGTMITGAILQNSRV